MFIAIAIAIAIQVQGTHMSSSYVAYISRTSNSNAHVLPCTYIACTNCNNFRSLASVVQCTTQSTIIGNCLHHFDSADKFFLTNNVVQMLYPRKDAYRQTSHRVTDNENSICNDLYMKPATPDVIKRYTCTFKHGKSALGR